MTLSYSDLINLYRFPVGRARFACRSVQQTAEARGEVEIAAAAAATVELATEAARVRRTFDASKQDKRRHAHRRTAKVVARLERSVGALHSLLQTVASTLDDDEPLRGRAAAALKQCFPEGAAGITSLSYEEEPAAVAELLGQAQGDLAPLFEQLGLTQYVARIARYRDRFATVPSAPGRVKVTYDQVRATDARGQDALLVTVARIIGRFSSADSDAALGAKLLAPILTQNARIRAGYRRHSKITDVDPVTGDESREPDRGDKSRDTGDESREPDAGNESWHTSSESGGMGHESREPSSSRRGKAEPAVGA